MVWLLPSSEVQESTTFPSSSVTVSSAPAISAPATSCLLITTDFSVYSSVITTLSTSEPFTVTVPSAERVNLMLSAFSYPSGAVSSVKVNSPSVRPSMIWDFPASEVQESMTFPSTSVTVSSAPAISSPAISCLLITTEISIYSSTMTTISFFSPPIITLPFSSMEKEIASAFSNPSGAVISDNL